MNLEMENLHAISEIKMAAEMFFIFIYTVYIYIYFDFAHKLRQQGKNIL